jgi:DNA polymerase III sliding clamp (beta) subunit (PCNA family)
MDTVINQLVDSSLIKKSWWGKVTDKYWDYLGQASQQVHININSHIISDLFVYLVDKLSFKETLSKYSKTLSDNRGTFVIILIPDDKPYILDHLNKPQFPIDFEIFCRELNGEYYEYDPHILNENIHKFKSALDEIDTDFSLIINVG